jgi:hypothetical protein
MTFEGQEDELQKLETVLAQHPEVAGDIRAMTNPDLPKDKFFELAGKVNEREQPPRVGTYSSVGIYLNDPRRMTVEYFENGRITVSAFDDSE